MKKQLILNNSVLRDYSLVLFDLLMGPYQVLPLRSGVDLVAITMKKYSAFPKPVDLQKPHHQTA